MHNRSIKQFIRKFTTEQSNKLKSNQTYNISTFLQDYPLAMGGEYRHSPTQDLVNNLNWWERTLIMPVKRSLSDSLTSAVINYNFQSSNSYLPDEFLQGVLPATTKFFEALQHDFDGTETKIPLNNILKPELYNHFHHHHESIRNQGIKLQIKLNSVKDFIKGENYLSFGKASNLSGTIIHAPIYEEIGPLIYWRRNKLNGSWLLNELNFEYCFEKDEVDPVKYDGDIPSFEKRLKVVQNGSIFGIEAIGLINFTASFIGEKDGQTKRVWEKTFERDVIIRFETQHILGRNCEGRLKIADIDNFFQSSRFEDPADK
jgi:hypothetical protein